jgi:hypothetical protein
MVGDVNAVERRNTFRSTISSSAVSQAMTQRQTSSLFAIVVTSWPITIENSSAAATSMSNGNADTWHNRIIKGGVFL